MTPDPDEFSFNPIIPAPGSNVAQTQESLLANFMDIYSGFLRNHVALNDPTNPGNHSVIELKRQEQDLIPSTQPQEIAIYSKKVDGQIDQIYMRYTENGKEFQISQYQIYDILATATQTFYFSFLPGGLLVYFGQVNPTGNEFNLQLQPAICSNIVSINLCCVGPIPPSLFKPAQSNVSLEKNDQGIVTSIVLTASNTVRPPSQYYIVVGNI